MNRAAVAEGNRVHFWCPGCNLPHGIVHGSPNGWTWNGSLELPTFSPSVLVQRTMGNYKSADDPEYKEVTEVCHSFVSEGVIQFLSDCTHLLTNQYVELPLWPYDVEHPIN
jgi:hypothetical protein